MAPLDTLGIGDTRREVVSLMGELRIVLQHARGLRARTAQFTDLADTLAEVEDRAERQIEWLRRDARLYEEAR